MFIFDGLSAKIFHQQAFTTMLGREMSTEPSLRYFFVLKCGFLCEKLPMCYLQKQKGISLRADPLKLLERETGFEPATLSLEG